MKNVIDVERTLGFVGLFLLLVVARLTDRAYWGRPTIAGRVSGFFARRAIDGVAAIGWLIDRLPLANRHVARTRDGSPLATSAA